MPWTGAGIRSWSRWMGCRSGPSPRLRLAEIQPGPGVADSEGQASVHAADIVDDLLETGEVELDEMIDVNAGGVLDGLPEASRAAERERRVNLLHLAGL